MRVLILTDELFASRERSMLTRLEVGLADEGVRVVHVVPESVIEQTPGGAADLSGVFSRVVFYSPGSAFTRGFAVRRISHAITQMDDVGDIDVVHIYGGAAWALGLELAAQLEADVVVEVWRAGLVERARALRGPAGVSPLFLASDPALERAFTSTDGQSRGVPPIAAGSVRTVPWGVLAPGNARAPHGPDQPISAMIIGNGRDGPGWVAALEALAAAAKRRELLIFCDGRAARRAGAWAHARRLGLLDRLSLIEELEGRRDLLLQGDLLVLPEANGEQRSAVLEAMGCGMVVVAAEDPMSDILRDGNTARLAKPANAASWEQAIANLIDDPASAAALSESAHRYVRAHRRASDQVRGVMNAYEWLGSSAAIPFQGDGPGTTQE